MSSDLVAIENRFSDFALILNAKGLRPESAS